MTAITVTIPRDMILTANHRPHWAIKARKTATSCQTTTPHVIGSDLGPPVSCRPGATGSPPTGSRS